MKTLLRSIQTMLLALGLWLPTTTLLAQATAFTYQGHLTDGTTTANGVYDVKFALFQDPIGGNAVLGPVTNSAVTVSNGLFVTFPDFGPFDLDNYGRGRWLEISVRTNGSEPFAVQAPRQAMTPAPKAIYSDYSGGAPPGYALNADLLNGVDANFFWQIGGNPGTTQGVHFLGTTDNQPLEIRANNQQVLRLAHATSQFFASPNIVGGFRENSVAPGFVGGFIAAGGLPSDGIFPASPNVVNNHFGSIGGGFGNYSGGFASVVDGGRFNFCGGGDSVIGGGYGNTNLITGFATIGGGHNNIVNAHWGTVPGGANNTVTGQYGFAAGRRAKANHTGAWVWADSIDADFASTANNQFSIRAQGGVRLNTDTSLLFGNQTRQMLNLWSTEYGIGVQTGTEYFRSPNSFCWFQGGVHHDGQFNAGAGGIEVMRLGDQGGLHLGGPLSELSLRNRDSAAAYTSNPPNGERWALYSRNEAGGGRLFVWSNGDKASIDIAGNFRTAGAINPPSDRNVKANFANVNGLEVLEKVAALPIRTWNYTNDPGSRHIGPVSQDFHAAFGLGLDDKSICTVDADGVALAAIQGLNQKLTAELKRKDAENAELNARLADLEQLVTKLISKGN